MRALGATLNRATARMLERLGRLAVVVDSGVGAPRSTRCLADILTDRCRAAFVVTGMLRRMGDSIGVFATISECGSAAPRRELRPLMHVTSDEVGLARESASVIAGAVAALSDTRATEVAGGAHLPSYEAYVAYGRAIDLTLRGSETAVRELRDAAALDSDFAAPWLRILDRANRPLRDSALAWVTAHRTSLSERDQLLADAIAEHNRGAYTDWLRATRRLRELAPHDPSALIAYANAAYSLNYYAEALAALRQARRLPNWKNDFSETSILEINALHDLGHFEEAIRVWRNLPVVGHDVSPVCTVGILQLAAAGHVAGVDSLVARCNALPDDPAFNRFGRMSVADELYRRAGREFFWHGYRAAARHALDTAYALERHLYEIDSSANDGWLAKDLLRDGPAAYALMRKDVPENFPFELPCPRGDWRFACYDNFRIRFAVNAGRVGDTAVTLATLRWLRGRPHPDSAYHVDEAKLLLALGRKHDALGALRRAVDGTSAGTRMHADMALLELRGDPAFEALVAPRNGSFLDRR